MQKLQRSKKNLLTIRQEHTAKYCIKNCSAKKGKLLGILNKD